MVHTNTRSQLTNSDNQDECFNKGFVPVPIPNSRGPTVSIYELE